MQSAVSLVKSYVPPDPARIQAAKDAGKVTIPGDCQNQVDLRHHIDARIVTGAPAARADGPLSPALQRDLA